MCNTFAIGYLCMAKKRWNSWSRVMIRQRLELVSSMPFECISYTKAIEILKDADRKFENTVQWGIDLASEHERYGD